MDKEKESNGATTTTKERVVPVNPAPFMKNLFGKKIAVKLKWGMEYSGILSCADAYMNLQLRDAEEYIEGERQSVMPKLMIRCNNILYIRKKDEEEEASEGEAD